MAVEISKPNIDAVKPIIRSLLLSLGKVATEREFRNAFVEMEGESFDRVLKDCGMNFYNFFLRMPDVANVHYDSATRNILITRVSNEKTAFMDNLTINKYSKQYKGIKYKIGSNNVPILKEPTSQFYNRTFQSTRYNAKSVLRSTALPFNRGSQQYQSLAKQQPPRNASYVMAGTSSSYEPFTTNCTVRNQGSALSISMNQKSASSSNPTCSNWRTACESTRKIASYQNNNTVKFPSTNATPSIQPKSPVQSRLETAVRIPFVPSTVLEVIRDEGKDCEQKEISKVEDKRPSISSTDQYPPQDELQKKNNIKKLTAPSILRTRLRNLNVFDQAIANLQCNQIKSHESPNKKTYSPFFTQPFKHGNKQFFMIKILDVISPEQFSFQYSLNELDDLMKRMNDFYNNLLDLESYKLTNIKTGMLVAVRKYDDNNRWYRAEVCEVNSCQISICYVDFRTVIHKRCDVLEHEIYSLEEEFASESAKSAIGKIHGIKPKSKHWCSNSKLEVMNSRDTLMPAAIKKIDNNIFSLTIIVNIDEFQTMSDYMVEQKYAEINYDDYVSIKTFKSLV